MNILHFGWWDWGIDPSRFWTNHGKAIFKRIAAIEALSNLDIQQQTRETPVNYEEHIYHPGHLKPRKYNYLLGDSCIYYYSKQPFFYYSLIKQCELYSAYKLQSAELGIGPQR